MRRPTATLDRDGLPVIRLKSGRKVPVRLVVRDPLAIRRAELGEMTAEEAETLLHREDPNSYDPTKEVRWTDTMAVAWIATRSFVAVAECSPIFAARNDRWRMVEQPAVQPKRDMSLGFLASMLENPVPVGSAKVREMDRVVPPTIEALKATRWDEPVMSAREALTDFVAALQSRGLLPHGVEFRLRTARPIMPDDFRTLHVGQMVDQKGHQINVWERADGTKSWLEVTVDAAALRRAFPKGGSVGIKPKKNRLTEYRRLFAEYAVATSGGEWPIGSPREVVDGFLDWVKDRRPRATYEKMCGVHRKTWAAFEKDRPGFQQAIQQVSGLTR
ncbi:MAG TPA: hypothetical protein VG757_01975 [Devosia sp.]|nr:hypothetical protein [Devosia sp.]